MPLRCRAPEGELSAFQISADAWLELKRHRRERELKMTCCDTPAIPKNSPLGTQFFAHQRIQACTTKPETKEHLFAKTVIARAALAAGWDVETESRGSTPTGEEWIADVLAKKGTARVAFEVQWSSQTAEETLRRQARYAASGVRALWLLRQRKFPCSRALPAFHLTVEDNAAVVGIPLMAIQCGGREWAQEVPLEAFVTGALSRRLQWAPVLREPSVQASIIIHCGTARCWNCRKDTRGVVSVSFGLEGYESIVCAVEDFQSYDHLFASILSAAEARRNGIGEITYRYGDGGLDRGYFSNGCLHCDFRRYGSEFLQDDGPDIHYTKRLSSKFLAFFKDHLGHIFERWCFKPEEKVSM